MTTITRPAPRLRLRDSFKDSGIEIVGDHRDLLDYVRDMRMGETDALVIEYHAKVLDALAAGDTETAATAGSAINLDIKPAPIVITEPGLYDLLPADYHADPIPGGSLSQSRAKVLLEEGGPAKFRHAETVGREPKRTWDFGTVVHAVALGKGLERVVVVDAKTWQGKAAQQERDDAYAKGLTPILSGEMRQAEDMAEALTSHTRAMEVLAGQSEVAAFARHHSGLWIRGQLDKYAPGSHIGDYKTAADASSEGFTRAVWRYRYHMQAAWYRSLVQLLTGELLPYRLVAQEKTAPYLVSVWEAADDYLELGRADMEDAIAIYRQCSESGEWPGYPNEIQTLSKPDWAYDDDIEIGE